MDEAQSDNFCTIICTIQKVTTLSEIPSEIKNN